MIKVESISAEIVGCGKHKQITVEKLHLWPKSVISLDQLHPVQVTKPIPFDELIVIMPYQNICPLTKVCTYCMSLPLAPNMSGLLWASPEYQQRQEKYQMVRKLIKNY